MGGAKRARISDEAGVETFTILVDYTTDIAVLSKRVARHSELGVGVLPRVIDTAKMELKDSALKRVSGNKKLQCVGGQNMIIFSEIANRGPVALIPIAHTVLGEVSCELQTSTCLEG